MLKKVVKLLLLSTIVVILIITMVSPIYINAVLRNSSTIELIDTIKVIVEITGDRVIDISYIETFMTISKYSFAITTTSAVLLFMIIFLSVKVKGGKNDKSN